MAKKRGPPAASKSESPPSKRAKVDPLPEVAEATSTSLSGRPRRTTTKINERSPPSKSSSTAKDPTPARKRGTVAKETKDNAAKGQTPKPSKPKETKAVPRNSISKVEDGDSPVNTGRTAKATPRAEVEDDSEEDDTKYWLMKAEPESRLEKGVDVAFSIDMLRDQKDPEPWDGNNWRSTIFEWQLTFPRRSQSSGKEQYASHEKGRFGLLLSLQLQDPWHRWYHGDCGRAFC